MNTINIDNLILQIKGHEGFRPEPYLCESKRWTLGYGRCIDKNGPGISDDEKVLIAFEKGWWPVITRESAGVLLLNDITRIREQLFSHDFYCGLDEVRQCAIINMAFNLGVSGLLKFKKMISALENKDWRQARIEMINSRWSTQVGRRSEELAEQMLSGRWRN